MFKFMLIAILTPLLVSGCDTGESRSLGPQPAKCIGDNGGLTLPPGFCATIFADGLGHARHLAVADDGTVFVNTWMASFYQSPPPPGGSLVALRDTNGDGRADIVRRFGEPTAVGGGGSGIGLFEGHLYAEVGSRIVRYVLASDIVPSAPPVTVVSGLPLDGDHPAHPFIISPRGDLFVNSGSRTNSCQIANRMPFSAGRAPCSELETRAGIWRFDARGINQPFSTRERYATGIRNVMGLAFADNGDLLVTQHGRDQLSETWPNLYTPDQGPELPAEEMLRVVAGGQYGWPNCYYDGAQKKLVLAPEYGGDGGKSTGLCADRIPPIAAFPAHWAPNALLIYRETQFPNAYRGGAFIAFHGSWNRAPKPQDGFRVVFQPFQGGNPRGSFTTFADGFAGEVRESAKSKHQPSGLAIGPDGSMYISDDMGGRIWKVFYVGNDRNAPLANAPPLLALNRATGAPASQDVGNAQALRGGAIFRGETGTATCSGCHGRDARGGAMAPDLTDENRLWGDGSYTSLRAIIVAGVSKPKRYPGAMPPLGGARLSRSDVDDVTAYLRSLSKANKK